MIPSVHALPHNFCHVRYKTNWISLQNNCLSNGKCVKDNCSLVDKVLVHRPLYKRFVTAARKCVSSNCPLETTSSVDCRCPGFANCENEISPSSSIADCRHIFQVETLFFSSICFLTFVQKIQNPV